MKTCHEAMPQIKTKPPFRIRACMCVCLGECVSGHKMTAPMQWQQLQFVRACPRGNKQAREAGRFWLQLALWMAAARPPCRAHTVGRIWLTLLSIFASLSTAFAALRASLKGGRMQPRSNNSSGSNSNSRSSSPHNCSYSLCHPCPAFDAGKFAARQRNEAMRTKSRN